MSWLDLAEDFEFWWGNKVPFGVVSIQGGPKCCATAVGDHIVDLSALDEAGCFEDIEGLGANVFWGQTTMDAFLDGPAAVREQVHQRLQEILQADSDSTLVQAVIFDKANATIHVPFQGLETDQPSTNAAPPTEDRYQHFKLYGFWKSSSTWRVRVALAAKKIPYESIPIHIFRGEQHASEFVQTVNPMGQIPVLEFTDTLTNTTHKLSQSVAILEFLEEAFPRKRFLFPKDPLERAVAYQMIEIINSGTQPLENLSLLQQRNEQAARAKATSDMTKQAMAKGLAALEVLVVQHYKKQSTSRKGPYALGTFSPSVVEVFLVPQMATAKQWGVDLDHICPALLEMEQLCARHKWFQQSHPDKQPDAIFEG